LMVWDTVGDRPPTELTHLSLNEGLMYLSDLSYQIFDDADLYSGRCVNLYMTFPFRKVAYTLDRNLPRDNLSHHFVTSFCRRFTFPEARRAMVGAEDSYYAWLAMNERAEEARQQKKARKTRKQAEKQQ